MRRAIVLCGFVVLVSLSSHPLVAVNDYTLGPDSQVQPGVPRGTVTEHTWTSTVFPGTARKY
jgi:hypothetical protein